ncbi:MAG TPA: hypothetical protein EYP09_06850 [Anaerolineae bacterium]|nr:hypothetical protein [Anaerolineae bacterium]
MMKVLLPGVPLERQIQLYRPDQPPDTGGQRASPASEPALTPLRAAGLGAILAAGGAMALFLGLLWLALWGLSAGSSILFLTLALGSFCLGGLGLIGAPALWGYALVRGLIDFLE